MTSPTDQNQRDVIIGAWLTKLHDLLPAYGKDLTPQILDDFSEALSDLSPEDLNWAFGEWRKIGRAFPVPADIRNLLNGRVAVLTEYAAEKAWDLVRWTIDFFYYGGQMQPTSISKELKLSERIAENTVKTPYGDGFLLHPKPFDGPTEYAIRAVGGVAHIAELGAGKDFDFCRREFLKAYRYGLETKQLTQPPGLPAGDATKMIEELTGRLKK